MFGINRNYLCTIFKNKFCNNFTSNNKSFLVCKSNSFPSLYCFESWS